MRRGYVGYIVLALTRRCAVMKDIYVFLSVSSNDYTMLCQFPMHRKSIVNNYASSTDFWFLTVKPIRMLIIGEDRSTMAAPGPFWLHHYLLAPLLITNGAVHIRVYDCARVCVCNRFIVINISRKLGERTENFQANSREIRSNPRQFGKLCVPNIKLSAYRQMLLWCACCSIKYYLFFFFFNLILSAFKRKKIWKE